MQALYYIRLQSINIYATEVLFCSEYELLCSQVGLLFGKTGKCKELASPWLCRCWCVLLTFLSRCEQCFGFLHIKDVLVKTQLSVQRQVWELKNITQTVHDVEMSLVSLSKKSMLSERVPINPKLAWSKKSTEKRENNNCLPNKHITRGRKEEHNARHGMPCQAERGQPGQIAGDQITRTVCSQLKTVQSTQPSQNSQ